MYQKIEKCRICGNPHLELVLDLGMQMLTGVFPREVNADVTVGPLRLVKCTGADTCGLLQLEHSYDLSEMYGKNYGYRSGLNVSMVQHLQAKVKKIVEELQLKPGDLIVDIGANDSTTLQAYSSTEQLILVGIDPTGIKFKEYYPPHIQLIPEFFSGALLIEKFPNKKAKVITSFSMFYDLEDPTQFMREIYQVLADDGIWVFEQSYMPTMLEMNSYDTACHEHLEYYGLKQIKWMADRVGFKIIDVEFNDINGGSFSVTVSKTGADKEVLPEIQKILDTEIASGLESLGPYLAFSKRVAQLKEELVNFISSAKQAGKTVAALGASTKGNVLLQYCRLNANDVSVVAEVNPEKFNCYTPGSWIPIEPQADVIARNFDYYLVLPWHFKDFFKNNLKLKNSKLLFPLPYIEIIH